MKLLCALSLALTACGSGSSGDTASGACPSLAGTWTIASHCVSSFVGQAVTVNQSACSLTLAAPFTGYSGTIASDGKVEVSGPVANSTQTCSGTTTATSIDLACPGPCAVTLTR